MTDKEQKSLDDEYFKKIYENAQKALKIIQKNKKDEEKENERE